MKKTILLAVIATVCSLSATYAQDSTMQAKPNADKQWSQDRRGKMYDDLNLTQDQKDKIKALDEDGFTQMKALKDDTSLSDDDRKAKMKDIRKAQKEKRNAILTPEQSAKLEAKMKERKAEGGQKSKE